MVSGKSHETHLHCFRELAGKARVDRFHLLGLAADGLQLGRGGLERCCEFGTLDSLGLVVGGGSGCGG